MFRESIVGLNLAALLACCCASCEARKSVPSPLVGVSQGADKTAVAVNGGLGQSQGSSMLDSSSTPTTVAAEVPADDARSDDRFRPDDRRPNHHAASLAEVGIHRLESKRLLLYTDVPDQDARPLLELVDRLYDELEDYFGPLPPNRAGTEFQMTGYLIRDLELFRSKGLLPEEFSFDHGVQRRNEFWVRDQEFDYYRRHLVLHEATHCFMNYSPEVDAPIWYLEGMAEYFAAHSMTNSGSRFRVMPLTATEFAGFGRLAIIRRDVALNKISSISSILALEATSFKTADPYAWSWALCAFLDGTPRFRERFRKLGKATTGAQFEQAFLAAFSPSDRDLATEWELFVVNLQYGYDPARAAIDFQPGQPLEGSPSETSLTIEADRGWQSTRVLLEAGQDYEIRATGRFTLANATGDSRPWESEPQGISYRYFDGRPIGTLIGCVRTEAGPAGGREDPMLQTITIGNQRSIQAPVSGTLYLRVNDAWNSLSDNRGEVHVNIRKVPPPESPESNP